MSGEHGEWYYYNTRSGTSQWDHPVDVWCRQMAAMHRQGKREAGRSTLYQQITGAVTKISVIETVSSDNKVN